MKLLRHLWRGSIGAVAVLFATLGYTWLTLPDVRTLRKETPARTAFMKLRAHEAADGDKAPRFSHRWVSYSRISPTLVRAVLVTEDAAFYSHDGVDIDEIRASMEINWAKGQFIRGGSTITQQLAKNLYLSPSKNPYRKLAELYIARRLEIELSKARILELYLNLIEWGDGIWGAEAAARAYFGVPASALSAEQSALLAGAIINPRVYRPTSPNARLRSRQQIILAKMGYVTPPTPPPPVPTLDIPIGVGLPPPATGGAGSE
jgi:monofunctional biosynthetic peptidoglycan transglycosylase